MANPKSNLGPINPTPQLDSHYMYEERDSTAGPGSDQINAVKGSADGEYGSVDGFRFGLTNTGMRHKQSTLGRKVRG